MHKPTSSARRSLWTFAAGAGCGFLAGAFVVAAVIWQFGNVIGSPTASRDGRAATPSAAERWVDGVDDAGAGVIEAGRPETSVATSGVGPVVKPGPSPEPVLTAPLAEALEGRDLLVPVEGVQPDQLVRSFAQARGGRQHEAIDILAPRNTPVVAIEGGKVARLFFSKAGGNTVYQFDPTEQVPAITTRIWSAMQMGSWKDRSCARDRSSATSEPQATPLKTRHICISRFSA